VFKSFTHFNLVQSKVFDDVRTVGISLTDYISFMNYSTAGDVHRFTLGGLCSNWQWEDSAI